MNKAMSNTAALHDITITLSNEKLQVLAFGTLQLFSGERGADAYLIDTTAIEEPVPLFADPDQLCDRLFNDGEEVCEPPLSPSLGKFVFFCIFIVVSVGFGFTAIVMAFYSGLALFPALAIYFVAATAAVLGIGVVISLLCSESYDVR